MTSNRRAGDEVGEPGDVRVPPLGTNPVLQADDWPQWRGPNRDGVCGETGLLESFPADGLKVRWRVPVGWGFSSPVVAQSRVYLADSEVVKPKAKERVHCFDETTGKVLWTHVYDVAYEDWAFDPKQEVGPVATPAVQNGKVYTVGRRGDLFCLDAKKGDVLWQMNMEKDYQAGSPLIEGELLILFFGGKAGVIALNKDTGKEVWKALAETWTYSSPIVITSGGKRQLIVWTQESVTALDPASGKTYWRQPLLTSADYAVSTPVFYNDRLLIGGMMFQLDSDKPAAKVLWPDSKAPTRRIFSHTSTALFRGEHVFSAKSSGELICWRRPGDLPPRERESWFVPSSLPRVTRRSVALPCWNQLSRSRGGRSPGLLQHMPIGTSLSAIAKS